MKTSALLINHNSGGTILKSIQSLIDQNYMFDRIVVVDNGSTDGAPDTIRQVFPTVHVVELAENCGLSYARNIGLTVIPSDLVLLVDDDVYLSNGALKKMMDAYRETETLVVCPRILLFPETSVLQCDGAAIHFTGTLSLRNAYINVAENYPERSTVNGFIGACLLINRKILMELGSFDEDYFFYFEDLELSYRLRALGYEICCEENAIVFHERGEGTQNLSFRGMGSYPARRAYFNLRNRWLTILLHFQLKTMLVLFPALALYEFAAFWEVVRRGWLNVYFKSIFSLIQKFSVIYKKRIHWQSERKIMDRDILSGGDLPLSRGFIAKKNDHLVDYLNKILNLYWNLAKKWL